jgi:hypothetical protein
VDEPVNPGMPLVVRRCQARLDTCSEIRAAVLMGDVRPDVQQAALDELGKRHASPGRALANGARRLSRAIRCLGRPGSDWPTCGRRDGPRDKFVQDNMKPLRPERREGRFMFVCVVAGRGFEPLTFGL